MYVWSCGNILCRISVVASVDNFNSLSVIVVIHLSGQVSSLSGNNEVWSDRLSDQRIRREPKGLCGVCLVGCKSGHDVRSIMCMYWHNGRSITIISGFLSSYQMCVVLNLRICLLSEICWQAFKAIIKHWVEESSESLLNIACTFWQCISIVNSVSLNYNQFAPQQVNYWHTCCDFGLMSFSCSHSQKLRHTFRSICLVYLRKSTVSYIDIYPFRRWLAIRWSKSSWREASASWYHHWLDHGARGIHRP